MLSWQNILNSRQIATGIEETQVNQGEVLRGEESVVFTFPYQTNGNHATELSTVGHVILRTALKRYFRFPRNCKQLRVEASNSMPNWEIYFPIFSETIHTNLKMFSQHDLRKCR